MATQAELNQLQTLINAEGPAWQRVVDFVAAHGGRPISTSDLYGSLPGQAGGVNLAAIPDPASYFTMILGMQGMDASADTEFNQLLAAFQQTNSAAEQYYFYLFPQKTSSVSWTDFLPILIVGGGAALAALLGGVTAGTAAGASAGASSAGTGASVAGTAAAVGSGATSAELGTTAASLGSIASSLGTTTLGSIASDLGSAVSTLTGSSTVGSFVSDLFNKVGGIIGDIENILSPVIKVVSDILNGVNAVTSDISKVTNVISKDYNTISGLVSTVDTLAHSGLQGILAIPSTLSAAFTNLDAANLRLAQATGQINTGIATDVLVPGIGKAIADPVANIGQTLTDTLKAPIPDVGQLTSVHLNEDLTNLADLTSQFNTLSEKLAGIPVVGAALAWLLQGLNGILADLGAFEHIVDLARQTGWEKFPVKPIDPGDAIRAWWRGQMSETDARTEMQRIGLDATRQTLLHDLEQWLPGIQDALKMFYRSVIDGTEMRSALAKQGLSDADITALLDSALEPVNPREAIHANGRLSAAQAGFLQQTLTMAPPPEYSALYPPRLANPNIAKYDWIEHWRVPALSWWITAYFRGLATEEEVKLAAQAENIPPEVIPNLIPVESEVVQLWMIPDMLASGVFTEAEALDYLHYIGLGDRDAQVIIKYGMAKAKTPAGALAQQLAAISVTNAKTMYEDGIISDTEYMTILLDHGYTQEAAALTLDLTKQQVDLSARKVYANGLIKEVEAGQITEQDMQTALYNAGFNTAEVTAYVTQLKGDLAAKAKLPTLAEVKDFWKAGLMTDSDVLNILTLDGYAPGIATAYLNLWKGVTGAPINTTAIA